MLSAEDSELMEPPKAVASLVPPLPEKEKISKWVNSPRTSLTVPIPDKHFMRPTGFSRPAAIPAGSEDSEQQLGQGSTRLHTPPTIKKA
jgi:hypothetical protein